jgi:hypothetical protein
MAKASQELRTPPRLTRSLLSDKDLIDVTDSYVERVREAVRERLEEVRSQYEDHFRELVEQWHQDTVRMEERLSTTERMVETLQAECETLRLLQANAIAETSERAGPLKEGTAEGAQPAKGRPSRQTVKPASQEGSEGHPRMQTSSISSSGLSEDLRSSNLEVIDKREAGGALWVLGAASVVKPILERLRNEGEIFVYASSGGKTTGGRAGWYTKSDK